MLVLGVVLCATLGSGCATQPTRVEVAEQQIDDLASALDRGDIAAAQHLMSNDSEGYVDLFPVLPADTLHALAASLRTRVFRRETKDVVMFSMTTGAGATAESEVIYVRFSAGEEGIDF